MRFNQTKIYPDEKRRIIAVFAFISIIIIFTIALNFLANDSLVPDINAKSGDETLGISTEK
jgi:hypothetical protein